VLADVGGWDSATGRVTGDPRRTDNMLGQFKHELEWYQYALTKGYGKTLKKTPGWRGLAGVDAGAYQTLINNEAAMLNPLQNVSNLWNLLRHPADPGLGGGTAGGDAAWVGAHDTYIPLPTAHLPALKGPPATFAAGGLSFGGVPYAVGGGIPTPSLAGVGASSAAMSAGGNVRSAASQASGGPGGANVTFGDINIHNPRPEPASGSITRATQRAAWLAGREIV
jgi:hypothetical protein